MNKQLLKVLRIVLPLGLGIALAWYSIKLLGDDGFSQVISTLKTADPLWIAISLSFALLSHISRAYRWKFMLEPLGYTPKLKNSFAAVMIAYFVNTFVIRAGEIMRGVVISKTEKIPFEKAFGTIVSERIADLIMLILIMTIAVILQSTSLIDYFFKEDVNPLPSILALLALLTIGVVGLRILKQSKHPLIIKVRDFGLGVLEGVKSILYMKKNGAFILHTLFIWTMYIMMFWVMKFTVPGIASAPLGVILAAFVVGAFSMSASNGGLGAYPIGMAAIFTFFGYEEGAIFGWIIWGIQTLFNIVVGGSCGLLFLIRTRTFKF